MYPNYLPEIHSQLRGCIKAQMATMLIKRVYSQIKAHSLVYTVCGIHNTKAISGKESIKSKQQTLFHFPSEQQLQQADQHIKSTNGQHIDFVVFRK